MTKAERLEAWIFENHMFGGIEITSRDVADALDISWADASAHIQAYLALQRQPNSTSLYVLHREKRTSKAVWFVGVRTVDAQAVSHQFFDDVKQKWYIAVEPDLKRIGELNPRARRKCEAIIGAVGENAMNLLRIAIDGVDYEGGD